MSLPLARTVEGCETVETSVSFPACTFPTAALSATVNAYVERRAREQANYPASADEAQESPKCEGDDPHVSTYEASCAPPYVVADVASYLCRSNWTGGGHPDGAPWAINVRFAGSQIRALALQDVLAGPAAEARLWRLVQADLRAQLVETSADEPWSEEELAEKLKEASEEFVAFSFNDDGLVISWNHYAFGYSVASSTVPYAKLQGILRPELSRNAR